MSVKNLQEIKINCIFANKIRNYGNIYKTNMNTSEKTELLGVYEVIKANFI
jgi:hypothetical protein